MPFVSVPDSGSGAGHKLSSLYEIMKTFNAALLQETVDELRSVACSAAQLAVEYRGSTEAVDAKFIKRASKALDEAISVAEQNFSDVAPVARRARNSLGSWSEYAAIESEVNHVADAFGDALGKHVFLTVAARRKTFIDQPALLGLDVPEHFPEAKKDIMEAGNCLAAECGTAAVFHLMRVVELGLRGLCKDLGLLRIKKKNRLVPISYADWETLLNKLNPLVDAKIEKMKRGKAKQEAQQFY